MLTVLLLAGCSADEEANGIPADEDVLELAVCTHDMDEDSPTHAIPADDSPAFTRAIPTGYTSTRQAVPRLRTSAISACL